MSLIKVLLVDDNVLIRKSFRKKLSTLDNIEIVGECDDGDEVISFIKNTNKEIAVIFMDVVMLRMSGIDATREIKKEYPEIKILGFSLLNDDEVEVEDEMRLSGADGFISKFDSTQELILNELKNVGFKL